MPICLSAAFPSCHGALTKEIPSGPGAEFRSETGRGVSDPDVLGFRTIDGLLDVAPAGLADQVKQTVEAIPGVVDCHQIRARHSGPHLFIDIHVHMDGNQTLREAHDLSDRIEQLLQASLPDADVTVHPEPKPDFDRDLV